MCLRDSNFLLFRSNHLITAPSLICTVSHPEPHAAGLDVELCGGRLGDVLLVRGKSLLDDAASSAVLVDNLDTAADVQLGLEHGVELAPDGLEVLVVADALHKVVWLAL